MKQTIKKNRDQILQNWFRATIDTYPPQSARVLGKDANRFDNPVGAVTRESLEDVLNLIVEGFTRETLEKALDPVIRIRAVQAFDAADAVRSSIPTGFELLRNVYGIIQLNEHNLSSGKI